METPEKPEFPTPAPGRSPFGRWFSTLSIRYKLVGLLVFAVLLPLSGLLYFGWKYQSEYRELLVQQAFIACQGSVNEVENGFEKEKARLLARFRRYRDLLKTTANPAVLRKRFLAIEKTGRLNWIEVRDIDAEVLLTTQKADSKHLAIVAKSIARLGINRFLGQRLALRPPKNLQPAEVLVQEFFEGPIGGWGRVFESPDELHRASFADQDIFYYWDIFPNPEIKPAFVVLDQAVRSGVKKYLTHRSRERFAQGHGAIRMIGWSIPLASFLPEKPPEDSTLKEFVDRVIAANAPLITNFRWQGAEWLAAGSPGKRLPDTILVSLYPVAEIDRQIEGIRADLGRGILSALLLAVLIGVLFSRTVLLPVANLMVGVQALRRRDTSHRLDILQNDELGRLSATFNATSEILADVIYARNIQAMLIPGKAPAIAGFSADLINIPAADLGGDYCDIVAVGKDRWLLVIGDVTGHGVSSALITAMAKTVVSEEARKDTLSLGEMLACLNEMLYSQFKRRKCMTLFAAVLDTRAKTLDCINAGHPLPLLFRDGTRQPFPKIGAPPLGFSQRRIEYPQARITLETGDVVVLYTDILIETRDRTGTPLGTKGFAAICETHARLDPTRMRTGILDGVTALAGTVFDDDLTMIILRNDGDQAQGQDQGQTGIAAPQTSPQTSPQPSPQAAPQAGGRASG